MHYDAIPDTDTVPSRVGERRARVVRFLGWRTTVLVGGVESGGRFALIECEGVRGDAVPLHAHHREDEVLHVAAGELTVLLGGEELPAPAGSTLVLPRSVEHSFVVESREARVLLVLSPAGFEGFLGEAGEPMDLDGYAFERLVSVAARYGVDVTGPPPERRRADG